MQGGGEALIKPSGSPLWSPISNVPARIKTILELSFPQMISFTVQVELSTGGFSGFAGTWGWRVNLNV